MRKLLLAGAGAPSIPPAIAAVGTAATGFRSASRLMTTIAIAIVLAPVSGAGAVGAAWLVTPKHVLAEPSVTVLPEVVVTAPAPLPAVSPIRSAMQPALTRSDGN